MTEKTLTSSTEPRALVQLDIPDAVPVPWNEPSSALYGVGQAAINDGLRVFIEPYDTMAVGDAIDVYWDALSVPVATVDVDASSLNQRLGLSLPENDFRTGDFQPFYRVRRTSGGTSDSPARNIRVKLELPGGRDPDPSTPHNENLAAPQVDDAILQNGVDADQAARGVDVTIQPYPGMAEYDRIDFSWGGERLLHTVQAAEVGHPVVLSVAESTILGAGDGTLLLMYQVIDAVANRSDGWSLVTEVDVLAEGATLEAPFLPSWEGNVVDLDGLGDQDVQVQVLAVSPFATGDTVTLTWAGRTVSGVSVTWSETQSVTRVPDIMSFRVPNATVVAIAQGNAAVSYTLQKPGGETQPSRRAQVQVIGQGQRLPFPAVREATGGTLAADVAQATVDIAPYAGMEAGDLVTLVWSGMQAGGQPTDFRAERVISGSTAGQTVTFVVPGVTEVAPLAGGRVDVYYLVTGADSLMQESERLTLSVGEGVSSLPAPGVREAVNGVLAADVAQATVEIQPYAGMAAGDRVDLQWQGNQSGNYTDWLPVSSATVGHVLTFLVPAGQIASNDSVSVSYRVTRATGGTVDTSAILQLRVGETSALPAPTIDEARGGTLDPADAPDGATVRVPAGAGLSAGDLVTVRWKGTQGPGSTEVEHVVSGNDAGHDITVTVPAAVVEASAGSRITLDYTVEYAGGSVGTSEAAVYEIASQAGTGLIKVMGARSQRKGSQHGPVSPVRTLSALNRDTLAPLEASWQYEGESTSLSGVRFRDTQPDRLLHVRTADDHITLSASNINGNAGAMVARRDAGNLVAWGQTANGGTVPPTISTLTDIIEVVSNDSAFAARRANGTVVAWGNTTDGGTVPPTIATLTDIVALAGTSAAFAALRANGTVVAWGATNSGGTVPSEIVTLTDIVTLAGTATAFSALRANGSVVAWGSTTNGGQVPSNIATLTDVVEVTANEYAFAALRANGHVVAWGSTTNGGSVPAEIAVLNDIVEVVPGNVAFAARRANGHVVAWGSASEGGSVPPVIATLDDIVQVTGMHMAFAALRANGHVVAWGDASLGGSVPSTIATLDDIVQVTATSTSSYGAFAALRSNGQVVAWGSSYIGGAPGADIQSQLTDVRAVYCANHAFAALTSDSRVVTWGTAASGGNSSSAQTQLTGQISYEAQPRFAWSESMGPLTGIPMLDAREGDLDAFFHPRAEFTEKLNDVLEKVAANFTHYLTSLIASPTEQQREIICEAALLLQKRNEYILLSGATEQCRQLEQALYARLDELKAYIPDRNAILESGLEHFDAQYRVIDKPFVADFLHEDDLFGYWRVAGNNPVALRGIQALPDNFPLTDEQYRTVMGDDALPLALQEKRIYMLDYHYLADAVAEEGFLKPEDGENSANIAGYSYAAMALFAVSKTTGKLMPVAIQCGQIPSEDTPLLLPTNGWGWEMAKYVINAADESEHQLASHLGLTHLLCEAFSLATVRNFQEEHPLYRLLISHFEGTNRINHNAISALLEPYKFVDQLFAAPLDKLLKKVVDARMTYDFSEHFLPKALENRGVNDTKALPDYPYRDDGLLIWNAIAEWVSSYINHYYITNDDIIQDSALMAWVNDIIANGKVKGFRSISTKDELRDTLTMIIFTTSAQHAAVNFTQPAWMMYAPSVCGTLAAPRPESVNKTHADWLNMLPGLLRAASKINIYTTLGEVYHGYLGEYIGWNGEDIFDPVSEPVIYSYLEDFRNKLSEINTIIEERNKTRPYSYPFLMPKNIPASINI